MDNEFLTQLQCPHCDASLTAAADSAELRCRSCDRTFPLNDGIPRFVEEQHLASFGLQWNKYEVAHDDEDRATFQAKTGLRLDELAGLRVLDAGCGGGDKTCALAIASNAKMVIGIDGSDSALTAARALRDELGLDNVKFVKGFMEDAPQVLKDEFDIDKVDFVLNPHFPDELVNRCPEMEIML